MSEHKHEFSVMITEGKTFHYCLECKLSIEHKDFMPAWEMRCMATDLCMLLAKNSIPLPGDLIEKYHHKMFDHVNSYMIDAIDDLEKRENE